MKRQTISRRPRRRADRHGVGRAAAACLFATLSPHAAAAQTQPATPAASAADDRTAAGDIVVTAQRKEQRLQDVPIAITALNASAAAAAGIRDIQSLNGKVPSLSVTENGPQNIFFLRGVGSPVAGPNGEQSVALYVDGVYLYSPVGNLIPIGADLERVEVLKGPQGTLFGRNATAGVIQIITRDPRPEPYLSSSIGYGNYDTLIADLYATTGISDNLSANVSMYAKHMADGYGTNIFNGTDTYRTNQLLLKSKWLWTPTSDTEVRATFSYTKITGSNSDYQIAPGHIALDGSVSTLRPYQTDSNFPNRWHGEIYFGALQVDQDLGFASLQSITSYRDVDKSRFLIDSDITRAPIVDVVTEQPSSVFTQEIRLLSPKTSSIDWVVGAFYIKANTHITPLDLSGLGIGAVPITINSSQYLRAISGYAQATVPLADTTRLTGGVRYNRERQHTDGSQIEAPAGNVIVPGIPDTNVVTNTSWRVSLDHKWTPDVMTYAAVSRGFKSGGYNLASIAPPYLPERLTSYEVGVKSDLFDRRVRLNVSGYYYQYRNIQVSRSTPTGVIYSNGPSAKYKGIDGDLAIRLSDNLTLSGGLNYVSGHYGSFPNAVGYGIDPRLGAITLDATGNRTVYTPKWSGNAALDYNVETTAGTFTLNGNVSYLGRVFTSPSNRISIPSYAIANASAKWQPERGPFSVRLWVLNAFDKQYVNNYYETGSGDRQIWAPPRTYGITIGVEIGDK